MLQCPNCKKFCITYLGTFAAKPDFPGVCPSCKDIYRIAGVEIFIKLLFSILGMVSMIWFAVYLSAEKNFLFALVFAAFGFLIFDYIAYKNFIHPRKYESVEGDGDLVNVKRDKIIGYLDKLTKSKEDGPFLTFFDKNSKDKYFDLFYHDGTFIFSLALFTEKQVSLKENFYKCSEKLSLKVEISKQTKDEQYLNIRVTDDIEVVSDILYKFTKLMFGLNSFSNYRIMASV